jgi:hypothetical protein
MTRRQAIAAAFATVIGQHATGTRVLAAGKGMLTVDLTPFRVLRFTLDGRSVDVPTSEVFNALLPTKGGS